MTGAFPRILALPYREDPALYFDAVRDRSWPVLLDSGGRAAIDIIAADPTIRLVTRGAQTRVSTRSAEYHSGDDPFALVRKSLAPVAAPVHGLPFEGGAIGYFGYDLGRRIERLPSIARDADGLPDMCIGIYDWAVVVDHRRRESWLVGQGRDPATSDNWDALADVLGSHAMTVPEVPFGSTGRLSQSLSPDAYAAGFRRILRYIRDGDCYQVNYALRFETPVSGDPWWGYRALRRRNPVPFGAYLEYEDFSVLSFSPERFLRLEHGQVETRPIKGTRPRGETPQADAALHRELLDSEKDRAENLMIVDLLRNDLGRVCEPGSIEVTRLFDVESFTTVHHLVSRIAGRLRAGEDASSLLRACFPGGSITGAPKIRAMQIIEELEPERRGIYCGAIGHIGFGGDMDTNIAIRTLVVRRDKAWFWAGGGIVADSVAEAEYAECLNKAGFLFEFFAD